MYIKTEQTNEIMITYVITVSRTFPATHPRRGEQTNFIQKIIEQRKYHTIRVNYPLWKKRFEKIEAGEACLSLRYWSGKPYRSKQVEVLRLTREDGIGIQKISMRMEKFPDRVLYGAKVLEDGDSWTGESVIQHPIDMYARNDGLTPEEFIDWFSPTFYNMQKKYPLWYALSTSMEMEFAVIHLTKYRY